MSDLSRMDRTWLCSVLFMDIASYSSQSVELQMKLKERFNRHVAEAIKDIPENERVILDTGDGAAICFLGAPEAAMFAALALRQAFDLDKQEQKPGLRVRLGVNLGPVRLVKDINGALNALGDGMNAGQRIMSFASDGQILVSQSFYEVVSRLSDDYKNLFRLKGVETDKHVREHTVYHLMPPGSPGANDEKRIVSKSYAIPLMIGVAALALAAVGTRYLFFRPPAPEIVAAPAKQVVADPKPAPLPAPQPAIVSASAAVPAPPAPLLVEKRLEKSVPAAQKADPPHDTPAVPVKNLADAKAEYEKGMHLIDDDNATEAIAHFDNAIRSDPDNLQAYVGRAEARRMLGQFEQSMSDCNKVIQLNANDARGHNCHGLANYHLERYDEALKDFDQALHINPKFGLAWANRGSTHIALRQWEQATEDYTQALRSRPGSGPYYMHRASAWSELKRYPKALEDYTEAIRLDPKNFRAFTARASVEAAMGDSAGAAADRSHARDLKKK